jgi:hypothetical protein
MKVSGDMSSSVRLLGSLGVMLLVCATAGCDDKAKGGAGTSGSAAASASAAPVGPKPSDKIIVKNDKLQIADRGGGKCVLFAGGGEVELGCPESEADVVGRLGSEAVIVRSGFTAQIIEVPKHALRRKLDLPPEHKPKEGTTKASYTENGYGVVWTFSHQPCMIQDIITGKVDTEAWRSKLCDSKGGEKYAKDAGAGDSGAKPAPPPMHQGHSH